MKDFAEAKQIENKIYLNGWTRVLVGMLWVVILGWLTGLTNNVIANDKESRLRDTNAIAEMQKENNRIYDKVEAKFVEQEKKMDKIYELLLTIKQKK